MQTFVDARRWCSDRPWMAALPALSSAATSASDSAATSRSSTRSAPSCDPDSAPGACAQRQQQSARFLRAEMLAGCRAAPPPPSPLRAKVRVRAGGATLRERTLSATAADSLLTWRSRSLASDSILSPKRSSHEMPVALAPPPTTPMPAPPPDGTEWCPCALRPSGGARATRVLAAVGNAGGTAGRRGGAATHRPVPRRLHAQQLLDLRVRRKEVATPHAQRARTRPKGMHGALLWLRGACWPRAARGRGTRTCGL